jgi:hypothetical protein
MGLERNLSRPYELNPGRCSDWVAVGDLAPNKIARSIRGTFALGCLALPRIGGLLAPWDAAAHALARRGGPAVAGAEW